MNAHVNGVVAPVHAVVQVEPELSLYSYRTDATPLLASAAVDASVTEPARFAAGAVIVTVGLTWSMRPVTVLVEVPVRAALSVAIAR